MKLGKRFLLWALSLSMTAGMWSMPVQAAAGSRSFFESVIRYIAFDDEISDYFGNTLSNYGVALSEGKYGKAGSFDGSAAYIDLGKIPQENGKSFSVAFWAKPAAGANQDAVLVGNKDWKAGKNKGWTVGEYSNELKSNAGNGASAANTKTYPADGSAWIHVGTTFTVSAGGPVTVASYINGSLYGTAQVSAENLETGLSTIIGRDSAAAVRFYNGLIDEMMLFNQALTAEEMAYAMTLGSAGKSFAEEYQKAMAQPYIALTETGGTVQLGTAGAKVPVAAEGIDASKIEYMSLSAEVAEVSADGTILPVSVGKTIISVRYNQDGIVFSGNYLLQVDGKRYTMSARADKSDQNPGTDGWGFMFVPSGSDTYSNMAYHSAGDIWYKSSASGDQYTRINGSGKGHHPGPENDVVITWTAPEAGAVRITGTITATAYSQYNTDGINLTVMKNADRTNPIVKVNETCSSADDTTGKDIDETVRVAAGDRIYFRIDKDINNSSDGFNFDPAITYTDQALELEAAQAVLSPGGTYTLGAEGFAAVQMTGASLNPEVAEIIVNADGTWFIRGVSAGETSVLLTAKKDGMSASAVAGVTVQTQKTPYTLYFRGAEEVNTDAISRVFVHLSTGAQSIPIQVVKASVAFDKEKVTVFDYKGNVLPAANAAGKTQTVLVKKKKEPMASTYVYDGSATRVDGVYFTVKDSVPDESVNFRVTDLIVDGVYYDLGLCTVTDWNVALIQNPAEDKNGDGLISVGDVAKAAADGADTEVLAGIAAQAGFYPVKRVFVLGLDGAGNSIDPKDAWYRQSDGTYAKFSALQGGKPEDKRYKFYENTILTEGAYTFDNLPCKISESAQNWTAILHGYNYFDISGSGSKEQIDNATAGAYYFPEEQSKYSSFMKVAREQMPNRKLMTNINWTPIDMGIIEQSIGISPKLYTNYAYDGRDDRIADGVVQQINAGETKNMSVMFVHFDELDHAGHDAAKQFYSDAYYQEAQKKDAQVQKIYEAIFRNEDLKDDSILITTTDHGGINHSHGGNTEQELLSFLTINGVTINPGFRWDREVTESGYVRGQTRNVPAIVARALGLTPDPDWKGFVENAAGAFLSQQDMAKKNRDIEKATADGRRVYLTNVKSLSTVADITLGYTGETAPEIKVNGQAAVLLQDADAEKKTVRLIVSDRSGFAENESILTVQNGVEINIQKAMLAGDSGKEIYPDLAQVQPEDAFPAKILSVQDENGRDVTADTIKDAEKLTVQLRFIQLPQEWAVLLAGYDAQGALIDVASAAAGDVGDGTITVGLEANPFEKNTDIAAVKVMLVSGLNSLKPLAMPRSL